MSEKPKVAFYWCASCGGCEEAVVDLAENILDVVAAVDIVLWPVALDFKRKDVEAMPDGGIVATFINGAIRTTEQEEMAHLLRRKSQVVIAFGACAQLGGIPGLANLWDRDSYFPARVPGEPHHGEPRERASPEAHTATTGARWTLPGFYDTVQDPRPGGRRGLLHARLPSHARPAAPGGGGAAQRETAPQRLGARAGPGAVRRMSRARTPSRTSWRSRSSSARTRS